MNSYDRYLGMVKGRRVDIVPRIPILMHFAARHIDASYADFAGDYRVPSGFCLPDRRKNTADGGI